MCEDRSVEAPSENLLAYLAENDGACLGCGYNLRGLREARCPECRMSYAALDRGRYLWISDQARRESRYLLFALIVLPIEALVLAMFTLSMSMGLLFWLMMGADQDGFVGPVLMTASLATLLAVWITSWIVFLRAYRKPLGRFAALTDDSRRMTRVGRAALIIDLLAALLGLVMIAMFVLLVV